MIRNPEQTIGKLADNAGYAVCTFIDEQGYPETQTLPQPLRREGIREFLFDIDPTAFALTPLTGSCPASLYFMDQRFYRGVWKTRGKTRRRQRKRRSWKSVSF